MVTPYYPTADVRTLLKLLLAPPFFLAHEQPKGREGNTRRTYFYRTVWLVHIVIPPTDACTCWSTISTSGHPSTTVRLELMGHASHAAVHI